MPLPTKIDTLIRQRLDELIAETAQLIQNIERDSRQEQARLSAGGVMSFNERHNQATAYQALLIKFVSLVQLILGSNQRAADIKADIEALKSGSAAAKRILGILQGLKNDYETGMLDSLQQMIESNIVADYMGQAEQLLGEGIPGQYDYVPAAVLTGAVLEDALRRLCQRQSPPINLVIVDAKGRTSPKMLNTLIDDLKKAGLYNELKAKQLRAWADIRNAAAHGEFTRFTRTDVEQMIPAVQTFLVDHL